jgi:hypothetical protein
MVNDLTYLDGEPIALAVVAVAGRRKDACRRGSWRRFEMPASLLNDDVDIPYLCPLEKLLFWGRSCRLIDLENMFILSPCLARYLIGSFRINLVQLLEKETKKNCDESEQRP